MISCSQRFHFQQRPIVRNSVVDARGDYLLIDTSLPPQTAVLGLRLLLVPMNPDLKHRPVMNLHQERGFTMSSTFVAPCASVVGDVRIIDHSCVWYGAVVRGTFGNLLFARDVNEQRGIISECVMHHRSPGKVCSPTLVLW